MQLKDIMDHEIEAIPPHTTLQEAALRMKTRHIGAVLVRDGDQFLGILTERDITMRATAEGRDPTTTTVSTVMTPEILWCFEDADATTAASFMREKQIRHLAVLNRHQQLVGIVSLYALALHLRDDTLAGTAIRWPA